nr:MAG TPA: hypothetical protein [Caudoviricetes sp.]
MLFRALSPFSTKIRPFCFTSILEIHKYYLKMVILFLHPTMV